MVCGDTLVDFGGGFAMNEWLRGGVTRDEVRERLRPLLDLPLELVLPAHGTPTDPRRPRARAGLTGRLAPRDGEDRSEPGRRSTRLRPDARLAAPRLRQYRRPEGPPDRGGPSLDDGHRRPRPAPRPHPHRARPRRRPRRVQPPGRLYQDHLFALVVRMVPDRDRRRTRSRRRSSRRTGTSTGFRGGSVKSWLNRICVNAAMDAQRAQAASGPSRTRNWRTRAGSRRPATRRTRSGAPSGPSAAGRSTRR